MPELRPANYTDVILTSSAPTVTAAERAADLSVSSHRDRGPVVRVPIADLTGSAALEGPAVVIAEAGEVECFPAARQDLFSLRAPVRGLLASGWRITVVVPAGRMGDAHRALRGVPAMIQPWWEDDGVVCFGGREVP